MFSFFKSKKPSPASSPEPADPIPGPRNDADGFVVIDSRHGGGTMPARPSLYPNFDGHFGNISHAPPIPTALPHGSTAGTANSTPVNYLSGVPFKLSSELLTGDSNEIMKIQVDDILAIITSKMKMEDKNYDFGLERSVIAQA